MWLWLHCVLYAEVITWDIDIACYGTSHIRGERNEDILFRLVTPYAIHEVPLQYLFVFFSPGEPGHEKMCLISYANHKGADQPAHPRSLISAFVFAA